MPHQEEAPFELPPHGEVAMIPIDMDVFEHPAIRGLTELTFKLELNHTCNDPKGLYYAIEAMHQAILGFPPDQFTHYERGVSWDYGLPNPSCIVQFDWAPHLEHGNINYAMLAFTIPATSPHSGATVAALLRQAHSWGPRGESPYYHMTDSRNTPYRMTLSCLQMSQWVTNESRSRADRHQQAVRQMLRLQSRGRVHVNILPAYGAPYLTKDDVVRLAAYYFEDAQPPYRPKVKINRVVVEDISTYEWSLYVKGPKGKHWPTYLDHPERHPDHFYEYRLETTVSDHFKLCKFCHQTKPPCRSGKNWCHVLQERQQREDRVRAAQATRRYGALTLASIGSRDPRVEQAMLMGPPPLNPTWGKGKGKGRH